MRCTFALLGLLMSMSTAHTAPQGSWPDEASYISLSKKSWVLVIPARRSETGDIVLWDKDDDWLQQWIVPRQTPSGTKTVAITGDADDKRMVLGWHLENMDVNALNKLAGKYKAPAIAVAVKDASQQVAVAGWVSGEGAAWRFVSSSGATRESALGVIDEIFSGYSEPNEIAVAQDKVEITGQRFNDGWTEYRLESFDQPSLERLYSIPGVEVMGTLDANNPSVIVRVTDGRDIETVLRSAGISYR